MNCRQNASTKYYLFIPALLQLTTFLLLPLRLYSQQMHCVPKYGDDIQCETGDTCQINNIPADMFLDTWSLNLDPPKETGCSSLNQALVECIRVKLNQVPSSREIAVQPWGCFQGNALFLRMTMSVDAWENCGNKAGYDVTQLIMGYGRRKREDQFLSEKINARIELREKTVVKRQNLQISEEDEENTWYFYCWCIKANHCNRELRPPERINVSTTEEADPWDATALLKEVKVSAAGVFKAQKGGILGIFIIVVCTIW